MKSSYNSHSPDKNAVSQVGLRVSRGRTVVQRKPMQITTSPEGMSHGAYEFTNSG
jgi:hypothetical protein